MCRLIKINYSMQLCYLKGTQASLITFQKLRLDSTFTPIVQKGRRVLYKSAVL